MRISLFVVAAIVGLSSTSFQAAACNARGEFCGYPGWAANAFSGPEDRVPEYSWGHPANTTAFGYVGAGYGYGPAYGYTPSYGYVGGRYYHADRRYRR